MTASLKRPRASEQTQVVKIDPQRRIVTSTFFGPVDDATLLRHAKNIAADPNFDATFAELVDFTAAEIDAISEQTLRRMGETKSLFEPHVPHVVVVPTNEMAALARKYQHLARETRPNVFVVATLAQAYELLAARGYGR